MTPAERELTWRRWKSYVQLFPKRYRVVHHWNKSQEGTHQLVATLEEYQFGCTFQQSPWYSSSGQWSSPIHDWHIVEKMPMWKCERETYEPTRSE